jgi:hypothetical protein
MGSNVLNQCALKGVELRLTHTHNVPVELKALIDPSVIQLDLDHTDSDGASLHDPSRCRFPNGKILHTPS